VARQFDDGSSQYLIRSSAVVTAAPWTIAAWFNTDDGTSDQGIFAICDTSAWQWSMLYARGTASRTVAVSNTAGIFATTGTYSADAWHHACHVETSSTSRAVYLDGGGKGTNTSSTAPTGIDNATVGCRALGNGVYNYFSGAIAEAAIWNAALTDAEVAILAQGYSPLFVRPESLVGYWPLIRDTDDDIVGGYSMTPTNAPTVAPHPRIIYPAPSLFYPPATAAGGVLVPVMEYHYRHH